MSTTDPIEQRLADWRASYTDRRTIPRQMVDEADLLIRTAVRAAQYASTVALEQQRVAHQEEVTRLERSLDLARRTAAEAHRIRTEHEALVAEKVRLREEREQDGEEVTVKMTRTLGGWVLGDLEEIAYRLRCGGAVDDTALEWRQHTISANVPAPNLVPLVRPGELRAERLNEACRAPEHQPDPPAPDVTNRRGPFGWPAALAVLVLVAVVAAGGLVIW